MYLYIYILFLFLHIYFTDISRHYIFSNHELASLVQINRTLFELRKKNEELYNFRNGNEIKTAKYHPFSALPVDVKSI